MSRKTAREVALKLEFSRLMGGGNDYSTVLSQSDNTQIPGEEDEAFAGDITIGVQNNIEWLDAAIKAHAIGWSLERMPKVDLCILRIALYEMKYRDDIPHSVSINEAVELAKRYSGDKSPVFINGLLGTLSKELEGESKQPPIP